MVALYQLDVPIPEPPVTDPTTRRPMANDPLADPPMSMRERMLSGRLYIADDPELASDAARARTLTQQFNGADPADGARRRELLQLLLRRIGEGSEVVSPFYCDYGYRISIGARTFVNLGLVCLDVADVTIGDDVQVGPNVQLLTPTHPVDPVLRRQRWEGASPITIGDNVWLGGGVIVCPGVTIGDHSVIGAGAIVNRDIPESVVAVGNPAQVIRHL